MVSGQEIFATVSIGIAYGGAIISLARSLDMDFVAEGVETVEQRARAFVGSS